VFATPKSCSCARQSSRHNWPDQRVRIVQVQSSIKRARAFKILYLTAIIVAMLGWIWLLIRSLTWAII
jgi:hypothetical protein